MAMCRKEMFEQGKSASSPHGGRVYAIMESLAATARPQRPNFGKEAGEKSRLETGVGSRLYEILVIFQKTQTAHG